MRVLARRVERVFAGRAVELADRGARLHRVGDQPVVDEVELDDPRRLGERGIDRGQVAEVPVVAEVARRPRRRPAARPASAPRPASTTAGSLGVVDLDQLGRVARLRQAFRR